MKIQLEEQISNKINIILASKKEIKTTKRAKSYLLQNETFHILNYYTRFRKNSFRIYVKLSTSYVKRFIEKSNYIGQFVMTQKHRVIAFFPHPKDR